MDRTQRNLKPDSAPPSKRHAPMQQQQQNQQQQQSATQQAQIQPSRQAMSAQQSTQQAPKAAPWGMKAAVVQKPPAQQASVQPATVEQAPAIEQQVPSAVQSVPSEPVHQQSAQVNAGDSGNSYVPHGFVRRPAPGTEGRKLLVFSNHYRMGQLTKGTVYHYDVDINPPPKTKMLAKKIFQKMLEEHGKFLNNSMIVFDGMKNIFSPVDLKAPTQEFQVNLAEPEPTSTTPSNSKDEKSSRRDDFRVRIKKVATVNMEELERFLQGQSPMSGNVLMAINVLNVVLNHTPMSKFTSVIRGSAASFFPPQANPTQLPGCLEAWKGFFQSVRPGTRSMTVNVDVATACFYKGGETLAQCIGNYFRLGPNDMGRGLSPHQIREFSGFVKMMTVRLPYLKWQPKKKVTRLSDKSATEIKFDYQADEKTPAVKISVQEYFLRRYKITLKFPKLPCALVGPTLNAIPLEMCQVLENQRFPRQINPLQLSELQKLSQKPAERKQSVENSFEQLKYADDPILKAFQLSIEPKMISINARLLPCPLLKYGGNKIVTPSAGTWNMRDLKFFTGSKLHTFGVFNMATYGRSRMDENMIQNKMSEFVNMFERCGISCHPELKKGNFPIITFNDRQGPLADALRDAHKQMQRYFKGDNHPSMIFVLLAAKSVDTYAEIKSIGEIELGVATQCMLADKVLNDRGFPQYASNIALKVNVKLLASPGAVGINVLLAENSKYFDVPVMIMGADVTHPGAGAHGAPSIAGVVASMDKSCTRYMHEVRYQPSRVEEIQEMEDITTQLLTKFRQRTQALPQRILFFRDGVSDGQYERVQALEVAGIQRACAKLGGKVQLTVVIVKKRHHTRFFAADNRDTDRSGNLLPGLVVDSAITQPTDFDFFLQSQAGLLGTSRPTHYYVIHDDYKFPSNELQKLTYNLCYTYARCTRSVSIVPAAYYAHLICFRARYYVRGALNDNSSSDSSSSDVLPNNIRVHPKLIDSMFFM